MGRAAGCPTARCSPLSDQFSAERGNPLGQTGKFPGGRVLVDNSARDALGDFRLDLLQGLGSVLLLARLDRRLDGLDEGPDAAHARLVDRLARRIAADALLGLRRVRHSLEVLVVVLNEKRRGHKARTEAARPLPKTRLGVNAGRVTVGTWG